jgi:hypothetical protein
MCGFHLHETLTRSDRLLLFSDPRSILSGLAAALRRVFGAVPIHPVRPCKR